MEPHQSSKPPTQYVWTCFHCIGDYLLACVNFSIQQTFVTCLKDVLKCSCMFFPYLGFGLCFCHHTCVCIKQCQFYKSAILLSWLLISPRRSVISAVPAWCSSDVPGPEWQPTAHGPVSSLYANQSTSSICPPCCPTGTGCTSTTAGDCKEPIRFILVSANTNSLCWHFVQTMFP